MRIVNPQVLADLAAGRPLRLDLGAGLSKKADHYGVDHLELPGVDIVADLNEPLSGLPDDSVQSIHSRHTLEHVENFLPLMAELHRTCRPGAEIEIIVPHFSNPYFYSDPTHVRSFGLYTMSYLMDEARQPGRKVPAFYTKTRFSLIGVRFDFYRTSLLDRIVVPFLRGLVNLSFTTQEMYERRWVWLWPAWQIRYRLRVEKGRPG